MYTMLNICQYAGGHHINSKELPRSAIHQSIMVFSYFFYNKKY